tara:strand:+ start:25598 stop:26443 length:846 start_codon:yes stop_codon:yes gene_type:complete
MPSVSVGGNALSYKFNGTQSRNRSPVLVLIHGAGGNARDWPEAWHGDKDRTRLMGLTARSEGRRLEEFPVYALELPGHGKSAGGGCRSVDDYAASVAGFLDSLALENVILVGHSMGAAIALTLAVEGNDRIAGIALLGGSARLTVSDAILQGLQNAFEATVDNIVKYSWKKTTSAFFKGESRQHMVDAGQQVVYNDFLACSRFDLSDRLDTVTLPVLVIAGQSDRMVPLETSREMAESFQHAKLVTLEDCGHYMQVEKTRLVAEEISAFLHENMIGAEKKS